MGKEKTESGPVPPKKPLTGFMLFSAEMRDKFKAEGKSFKNVAEVSKAIGALWAKVSDEKKKPYNEKYQVAKKKYDKEIAQFKEDHPDVPLTRKRKAKDTKGKKPKKVVDPNAPKRPMTPFFKFSQEHREETKKANPELKNTDISKELSKKWKALSEDEQKEYKDLYAKQKAEYDVKLEAYEKEKAEKEAEEASEDEDDDSEEESEESDDDSDNNN